MNWLELYEEALESGEAAAGNYNRNVGVHSAEGKVNVRIPLAAADSMDLRVWDEEDVLTCIRPYVGQAPELRHVSLDPRFQVHHFIEGRVLESFSPRGGPVPAHVMGDVIEVMDQLVRIPREMVPALPTDWPDSGNSAGFGRRLAAWTQQVYDIHREEYAAVFEDFGIPDEPLAVLEPLWDRLTPRPFSVLHSDLHRMNMIISGGLTWFVDWELALWGDCLYDVAIHFHKMGYPAWQRAEFFQQWRARLPASFTVGAVADLDLYLAHERIKAAIVGTLRYPKQIVGTDQSTREFLTGRLVDKLNAGRAVWGSAPDMTWARVAQTLALRVEQRE
ncbi:phosphotransferase family protein [Streptomyces sp. NPDC005525]|uniref:phosphotransferase family protein n=1 Tax=Streptomyces sp. NPDC005525 TaxID=3364720 RepID=UPI00367D5303